MAGIGGWTLQSACEANERVTGRAGALYGFAVRVVPSPPEKEWFSLTAAQAVNGRATSVATVELRRHRVFNMAKMLAIFGYARMVSRVPYTVLRSIRDRCLHRSIRSNCGVDVR